MKDYSFSVLDVGVMMRCDRNKKQVILALHTLSMNVLGSGFNQYNFTKKLERLVKTKIMINT